MPGEIEIIPAGEKPLIAVCAALAGRIWPEYFTPMLDTAIINRVLLTYQSEAGISSQIKAGARYFLVRIKSEDIGYLSLEPRIDEKKLFLSKFYLLADKRGRGIGRKMMTFVETFAKNNGLKKIELAVYSGNRSAVGIYKRFGFSIIGTFRRDFGDGLQAVDYIMEKILS